MTPEENPTCCIYAQQALNGTTYTGKTATGYKVRIRRHNSDLAKGKHCNKRLQTYYSANGKDAVKSFVQEVCTAENLHERESYWIAHYRAQGKSFNILSGGTKAAEFKQLPNIKAKTWQLLSRDNNIVTFTNYFSWCSQNDVTHSIHKVLTGKQPHSQGWRNISELGKTYVFVNPSGNLIVVDNVVTFAEANSLDAGKLYRVIRGGMWEHNGYKNPQHLRPIKPKAEPRVSLTAEQKAEKARATSKAYYYAHKQEVNKLTVARRKNNDTYKEYMSAYNRREDVKVNKADYNKEYSQRENVKAKRNEYAKQYRQTEEGKAKRKEQKKRAKERKHANITPP